MGEREIEDVLQRLDRLTLDEARMTGTETLQVVHSLIGNVKLAMDGMQPVSYLCLRLSLECCWSRWQDIYG